jgi:hypothetical protein
VPAPHVLAGDRDSQGKLGQHAELDLVALVRTRHYIP